MWKQAAAALDSILFGGKLSITNINLSYFVVQCNELTSVGTCQHALQSDRTERKLGCLSGIEMTMCRRAGKHCIHSSHVIKLECLICFICDMCKKLLSEENRDKG